MPTRVPGAGRYRFVGHARRRRAATRWSTPRSAGPFTVRMDEITGARVKAWWFNPRNGEATAIGEFPNTGEREFTPPDPGEMLDWVLVLDDASKGYPAPGAH